MSAIHDRRLFDEWIAKRRHSDTIERKLPERSGAIYVVQTKDLRAAISAFCNDELLIES